MYRQLAVLLPQAPVPLVTLLQLWGVTDAQEARETVQIFVMQVRAVACGLRRSSVCKTIACV
jgi:hypothetical protein